jgi:hypothetical protein
MAKRRKKPDGDRHIHPPVNMRLHDSMRKQLDKLVELNASTLSEEIRNAIRAHLQKNGLWPTSPGDPSQN